MTIEHSLIPQGEQHVVANWVTTTVAALANIEVGFDDIGKQAWVQGVGHFTLANSAPKTWEPVSPVFNVVSATFAAIPAIVDKSLVFVTTDETNGDQPTLYFFDGSELQWIPSVGV